MLESLGFKKPGLKIEKNFSIEKKKNWGKGTETPLFCFCFLSGVDDSSVPRLRKDFD